MMDIGSTVDKVHVHEPINRSSVSVSNVSHGMIVIVQALYSNLVSCNLQNILHICSNLVSHFVWGMINQLLLK